MELGGLLVQMTTGSVEQVSTLGSPVPNFVQREEKSSIEREGEKKKGHSS